MSSVLAKYSARPVPRYTSYPTAPHFTSAVGDETYRGWLGRLDPAHPVSVYLHVPYCRQLCWYCGCNMKLAKRDEPLRAYTDTLLTEIDLVLDALPGRMVVDHLHWGGGTPTALNPDDLHRVMDRLSTRMDFTADAERAIEADPRTLTVAMIERLGLLGFNRASFGVQEFAPQVQAAINRVQPPEMVREAVARLRAQGIRGLNFDLIYGLPHQTAETLERTIDLCVEMGPDRFALFGYAHVPWMAAKQRMIPESALPGSDARLEQSSRAAERLRGHGYQVIGIDHFARPDDPLAVAARAGTLARNFQGYTTDSARTLIGLGASSISRSPFGYAQNITEPGAWARAVKADNLPIAKGHAFAGDDQLRAAIIEQLMCYGRVDIARYVDGGGLDRLDDAADRLAPLLADGVIERDGDQIALTNDSAALARVAAAAFDSYLGTAGKRHSAAV